MKHTDELDQQARSTAQSYLGHFAWPTVALGLPVMLAYAYTPYAVVNGQLPFAAGLIAMMVLTYLSYTVLHDAIHGSISGSHKSLRWINEAMGYMAAWVLMIPLTAHRHEHLAHHRNTNQSEGDPDFVVADMGRSPLHAVRAAVRIVAGQYSYYMKHRWQLAPRDQNIKFCLEIAMALGLRLLFLGQGYWMEGIMLFAVAGIGGVMLLMYLFAYIVHRPHQSVGRYVDTSTIIAAGPWNTPLTWLWGFQNYHSIHHLFPRVPFYQYRKLFGEIREIMIARGAPIYTLSLAGLQRHRQADHRDVGATELEDFTRYSSP